MKILRRNALLSYVVGLKGVRRRTCRHRQHTRGVTASCTLDTLHLCGCQRTTSPHHKQFASKIIALLSSGKAAPIRNAVLGSLCCLAATKTCNSESNANHVCSIKLFCGVHQSATQKRCVRFVTLRSLAQKELYPLEPNLVLIVYVYIAVHPSL